MTALLPGCSGGTSPLGGNGNSNSQPTATPTNTPVSTAPVALTPTTFTLQNGQRVTLSGTRTGTALAGKLTVAASTAQTKTAAAFPFSVTTGEYGFTGTFTPPRGFSIVGKFGGLGDFTMTGQLQTATQNGSYTLTSNGSTDTGILPATGTPTSTATPTPVPSTGGYKLSGSLAVSGVTGGSPVVTSPLNTFNYTPNVGTLSNNPLVASQSLSFGATDKNLTGNGLSRGIGVGLISAANNIQAPERFKVGQRFDLSKIIATYAAIQYSQNTVNGTSIGFTIWRSTSGEIVVRAIGTDSATLELVNVRMRGQTIQGTVDTAAGEFTLNGTLAATGLTVKTQ